MNSDKKIFKPFKMDWIKDFVSGSEFNNFELEKIEHDHFQKKGLILNFQKVKNKINYDLVIWKK